MTSVCTTPRIPAEQMNDQTINNGQRKKKKNQETGQPAPVQYCFEPSSQPEHFQYLGKPSPGVCLLSALLRTQPPPPPPGIISPVPTDECLPVASSLLWKLPSFSFRPCCLLSSVVRRTLSCTPFPQLDTVLSSVPTPSSLDSECFVPDLARLFLFFIAPASTLAGQC